MYFGISLFYFILTTTGSVSEKMGLPLARGAAHVLATVCLSGGHISPLLEEVYRMMKETRAEEQ